MSEIPTFVIIIDCDLMMGSEKRILKSMQSAICRTRDKCSRLSSIRRHDHLRSPFSREFRPQLNAVCRKIAFFSAGIKYVANYAHEVIISMTLCSKVFPSSRRVHTHRLIQRLCSPCQSPISSLGHNKRLTPRVKCCTIRRINERPTCEYRASNEDLKHFLLYRVAGQPLMLSCVQSILE